MAPLYQDDDVEVLPTIPASHFVVHNDDYSPVKPQNYHTPQSQHHPAHYQLPDIKGY